MWWVDFGWIPDDHQSSSIHSPHQLNRGEKTKKVLWVEVKIWRDHTAKHIQNRLGEINLLPTNSKQNDDKSNQILKYLPHNSLFFLSLISLVLLFWFWLFVSFFLLLHGGTGGQKIGTVVSSSCYVSPVPKP